MSLILCGPPMCGKSYFGKKAAGKMDVPFFDTDCLIEDQYEALTGNRLTCRDIFIKEGEEAFRGKETQVIAELERKPCVIALGGGALVSRKNSELLKNLGKIIFLKTEFSILIDRLERKAKIPAYLDARDPKGSLKALFDRRNPLYDEYADIIIDTVLHSSEAVVEMICNYRKKSNGQ
jgi:shikimate kinase